MTPHDQRRYECINARLCELEVVASVPIKDIEYAKCDGYAEHGKFPSDSEYKKFDGIWKCKADEHRWFAFNPVYPTCSERQSLFMKFETGAFGWDASNPQGLLFYDGCAERGIDVNHTKVRLPDGIKRVQVYAYSGTDKPDARPLVFNVSVIVRDERVHELQTKIYVLCNILNYLDDEAKVRSELSAALRDAVNKLDFSVPYSPQFYASILQTNEVLDGRVSDSIQKPVAWAIGHTHIDFAWLWTKAQTKEKVLRSFGTALSLLEEYPEYKFMSSQPALYEYVKEQDSEMYGRIKDRIAQNRWEAEGAMWVEPDCNLISGESMIRQIILGKQFFKQEFGVDSKVCWLPDVFGYSAALPQILKKAGVDTFVTSKISWNEYNRMPHEIFRWQGIDGSVVDAYFLTTQRKCKNVPTENYSLYNGEGMPSEVEGTYARLSDKDLTDEVLMPTGHGDGGGGTTPEMIERINYLNRGIKGCNRSGFMKVEEFFSRLKRSLQGKTVPNWVGELYLEFHRGTYTSIAKNKRNNRLGEFSVWRGEWEGVLSEILLQIPYPADALHESLKILLTNQFHDILPGSSIEAVYDETDREYGRMFGLLNKIEQDRLHAVADHVSRKGVCVFNPNSFEGGATVVWKGKTVGVNNVPSKGFAVFESSDLIVENTIYADKTRLESNLYRIIFNEDGKIVSFLDKRNGREIVKNGGLFNNIIAYENLPYEFDNWELKDYYSQKPFAVNDLIQAEVMEDGVRKGIKFTYKFYHSVIEQIVWLYENIERIDCETKLDWHEHHFVLRSESETTIHSDSATYEIQYGHISRPSHENTSWDHAKFEVCAHKYIDVSEYGYGLSLLNDCKYGHSVRGGKIGLTLLTCGTYPNPNADQGKHTFTYCFVPHIGDFRRANIIGQAYLLNNPFIAVEATGGGVLPERYSLVRCAQSEVIIEAVKRAEDGRGIIIRAYESCGGSTVATFDLGFSAKTIKEVNLMEEGEKEISNGGCCFKSAFAPFEIKTFYIEKYYKEE